MFGTRFLSEDASTAEDYQILPHRRDGWFVAAVQVIGHLTKPAPFREVIQSSPRAIIGTFDFG